MSNNDTTTIFTIRGMTCGSCVRHVREAISKVDGVQSVSVDLAQGRAQVRHGGDEAKILAAIEQSGYSASRSEESTRSA